jgi:hypothetical protein
LGVRPWALGVEERAGERRPSFRGPKSNVQRLTPEEERKFIASVV